MRNVRDKSCKENPITHFMFSDIRAVYEIMWKNMVEPDRPQIKIWRMRFSCWVGKIHRHTLIIFNTYCFSVATVVTRASFNILRYTYIVCLVALNVVLLCEMKERVVHSETDVWR